MPYVVDPDGTRVRLIRAPLPHWAGFWARSQYGTLAPEDSPHCPVEQNPYLPWWWRFERAELFAVGLILAGSAIGAAWLAIIYLLCRWRGVAF